jgi:flagellar basal-body rod protein FlgC
MSMIDPLQASLAIASSGLEAQSARLRVVAENLANASSTGDTPGADPYVRKTIAFEDALDRTSGVALLRTKAIAEDSSPFRTEYNPGHPAADENGVVKLPNVDQLVEMADMREANRGYQANLQAFKQARELFTLTLDLLKG